MQNVADIFARWPTDADFGRDIGLPYPTVSAWKQRGSIPSAYWRDIVRAARRRGYSDVTTDLLANLHARESTGGATGGFAEEEATPMAPEARTSDSGHFSRWKHLRRSHFASTEEIVEHVRALRDEWDRR